MNHIRKLQVVSVVSDVDGEYLVYVDNESMMVTVVNGTGNVSVPNLTVGSYDVIVTVVDGNYSGFDYTSFDVVAKQTDVSVSVDDIYYGDSAVVNVVSDVDGEYLVYVDGNPYTVDVADGIGSITVSNLTSGSHDVLVTVADDNYSGFNSTSFDVIFNRQASEISVNISSIKAGDVIVDIKINPNATGNVSVIVDSVETVVELNENGTVSIPVNNITAGEHSIVVIYNGDSTHDSAYKISNFTLFNSITTEFANITIREDLNITARLVDVNGNPISNAVVIYIIDNVSRSTVTGADGSFMIKGVTGKVIVFSYAGSNIYLATNTSIKFDNVVPESISTKFNVTDGYRFQVYAVDYQAGERGEMFDVLLTDTNGKPLANQTVVFAINAWVHNRTTDENGVAHLQINLQDANKYTCAPCYLGNTTYDAAFASSMVLVVKKPITITAKAKTFKATTKTKKYTVTLKTIKGSSADGKTYLKAGKKVTLKINGKTYTSRINAKGQATFKITKLTKKGKFTALIKFAGDTTYKAASKKVKITIK